MPTQAWENLSVYVPVKKLQTMDAQVITPCIVLHFATFGCADYRPTESLRLLAFANQDLHVTCMVLYFYAIDWRGPASGVHVSHAHCIIFLDHESSVFVTN